MADLGNCKKVYLQKAIIFPFFVFVSWLFFEGIFAIWWWITIIASKHFYITTLFVYKYQYPTFTYRSGRLKVFCKKGILKNFAKFAGKHLCPNIFLNKVAGLMLSCAFREYLRTHFRIEHLWWLPLYKENFFVLSFCFEFFLSIYCPHLWC